MAAKTVAAFGGISFSTLFILLASLTIGQMVIKDHSISDRLYALSAALVRNQVSFGGPLKLIGSVMQSSKNRR